MSTFACVGSAATAVDRCHCCRSSLLLLSLSLLTIAVIAVDPCLLSILASGVVVVEEETLEETAMVECTAVTTEVEDEPVEEEEYDVSRGDI